MNKGLLSNTSSDRPTLCGCFRTI